MNKVNEIINNKLFIDKIQKLKLIEKDRIFCKHGIEHLLDVARIAYIKNLEEKLGYEKEVIYGAALLHDLGRVSEYEENIPHHVGGISIAKEILHETSYTDIEIDLILKAIGNHRNKNADGLSEILYLSDKKSRNCFLCESQKECNWSTEKRNKNILY